MAEGKRVIVIGASMAGLVAARVMADVADEVLLFDRDELPVSTEARKGVPQGRHAHALLRAGELILEKLFPGLIRDLVERGAQRLYWLADALWWQFDGYRARQGKEDFEGTFLTRPFLEQAVRSRIASLPNIRIRAGVVVRGLMAGDGRVTGVLIDDPKDGRESIDADFVIDTSGRGSQSCAWLEALGYSAPPVDNVRIDMGYASRLLRRERGQLPDRTWLCAISTPPNPRLGVLFPVEEDRWLVTLAGFFGDHAPTDDAGFLEYAKTLATNDIFQVLRAAVAVSPIVTHKQPSEQWRHFERLERVPAGFVTLGDGICSFNPIYGQGMTSAAQQAMTLLRCAQAVGLCSPALPRQFYKAAAKVVAIPWQIAAGGDFFYTQTTGPRPPLVGLINPYIRKAIIRAQHDPVVATAVAQVQNLLAPPPSLLRPHIAFRVLSGRPAVHSAK